MKKFIALVAALMLATTSAQAGSISRGFSSSRSSVPAPKSMGMTRPAVTAQAAPKAAIPSAAPAATYRPASPAPAPVYRQTAPAPTYAAPAPSSPGLGSTFLAGAGGGLVGSMLGNAISGPHGGGGGTTVVNNGVPIAAGAAAAPMSAGQEVPVIAGTTYATQAPANTGTSTWSWLWQTLGFLFWLGLPRRNRNNSITLRRFIRLSAI